MGLTERAIVNLVCLPLHKSSNETEPVLSGVLTVVQARRPDI